LAQDILAEAFSCLPRGQVKAVAELSAREADQLAKDDQEAWALIWMAVSVKAHQALLGRKTR